MEKKLERSSATDDLLSQSYSIGVQKIAGTENDVANNFQVPPKILDERKKAWNNLFEKYSSMVSEVELNINTLQINDAINPSGPVELRLPMRKPMSMVQYWVDTGNLLQTNNTNISNHSDSGSSIAENECLEHAPNIDSQSLATDHHAEKHSNIAEISGNKNLRIAASSNSSLDTAAYILANNNITKKEETIAIVEGSKVIIEKQSPIKNVPQIAHTSKSTSKISLTKKSSHEQSIVENTVYSQSIINKSYVDKITENLKNANFDRTCKNKIKSKQQESNICSIFFSDSDESKGSNIQIESNQTSNNASKFMKRKKLYNRSDSPAEFTPVSEDNLSLHASKILLRKCVPLKRSEHPALETPKTSSRILFRTRCRQTQFKRKMNHRQYSSLVSSIDEQIESKELHNPSQNNDIILGQTISKNYIHMKESNVQHDVPQSILNKPNKMQEPLGCTINALSSCNGFVKNKFKLKPCKVVVQKLPHKYYLSSSSRNVTKNKTLLDQVTSQRSQSVDKTVRDYALLSNVFLTTGLSQNSTSIPKNKVKTFNNTKTFGDILHSIDKENKLSHQTNSSDKLMNLSEMPNNGNLNKTTSKYMLADSSSDESDLIVPLSSNKNKSVGKAKSSKQQAKKNISYQPSKTVESKKEIVKSLSIEQNGEDSNTSSNEEIKKKCSNTKERQKNLERNGTDDDVQHDQMKENVHLPKFKPKMHLSNFIKHKNKSRIMSSSSEEEEVSIPTKEKSQTVNLSTKSKQITKSTSDILSESKNTSNGMINCPVLLNGIHPTNNKVDKTKTLSKSVTAPERTKNLNKERNNGKLRVDSESFNNNKLEILGAFSNSKSDSKLPRAVSTSSSDKDSPSSQRSKLSPRKRGHRQNKPQKMPDSAKVKTVTTQKASTKKRKSFEINLSSDEECILPLKKKE